MIIFFEYLFSLPDSIRIILAFMLFFYFCLMHGIFFVPYKVHIPSSWRRWAGISLLIYYVVVLLIVRQQGVEGFFRTVGATLYEANIGFGLFLMMLGAV